MEPISPISEGDHCGYVILAVYASFFVTLLFWIVRIGVRWRKLGLKPDDGFLIGAMVLALGQTICMQLSVNAGLGYRMEPDEDGDIYRDNFEKRFYAANLLNVLSQGCSKISVSLMFHQLQPFRAFAMANFVSLALAAAWMLSSFLALAFQCELPHPWVLAAGRCVDLHAMLLGIDIVNIISEISLIAVPSVFMPLVQTNRSAHLIVISCFAARLGVVAPVIGHIVSLPNPFNYPDVTWAYHLPAIWIQVAMNASILTACIPGMQQILAQLRSGMLMVNVDVDGREASRYGAVFGTSNNNEVRTDISKADRKIWEMSRMDSSGKLKSTSEEKVVENEPDRRFTDHHITITQEVDQVEEYHGAKRAAR